MKRVLATAIVAGFAAMAISTTAQAAGNANAKIMLHALPLTTKNQCTRVQNIPVDCTGYNAGIHNLNATGATFYYAYLLVVNGSQSEGVAGLQCGIQYQNGVGGPADGIGVEVYGWSLCATLEFQTPAGGAITAWGGANGGNLITWDSVNKCQQGGNLALGAVAVAGYFYCGAYSPDVMRVVPRQVDNAAKTANCVSTEDPTYTSPNDAETFLGALGFGGPGINPCGRELPVATEPATWSGVKTLIGR